MRSKADVGLPGHTKKPRRPSTGCSSGERREITYAPLNRVCHDSGVYSSFDEPTSPRADPREHRRTAQRGHQHQGFHRCRPFGRSIGSSKRRRHPSPGQRRRPFLVGVRTKAIWRSRHRLHRPYCSSNRERQHRRRYKRARPRMACRDDSWVDEYPHQHDRHHRGADLSRHRPWQSGREEVRVEFPPLVR
jgi:hypothetical protein